MRGDHYLEYRRAYRRNQSRQRRARVAAALRKVKEAFPCADCGGFFPHYIMEFDHIIPRNGGRTVGEQAVSGSLRLLLEELAKCELICANCHRRRTWERRQQS